MARDHIWTERGWLLLEYYRDDVVPDVSFALQLLRVPWTVRQKGGDMEQHFSASKYLVHRRIARLPVSSVQTSAIPIFLLKKNSTKIIFTINSINNWYTYIYYTLCDPLNRSFARASREILGKQAWSACSQKAAPRSPGRRVDEERRIWTSRPKRARRIALSAYRHRNRQRASACSRSATRWWPAMKTIENNNKRRWIDWRI